MADTETTPPPSALSTPSPAAADGGDAAATRRNDEEINAVAMKLPLFWVDNPRMWFQTAEAQFRIKNITRSLTKFDHVLA